MSALGPDLGRFSSEEMAVLCLEVPFPQRPGSGVEVTTAAPPGPAFMSHLFSGGSAGAKQEPKKKKQKKPTSFLLLLDFSTNWCF